MTATNHFKVKLLSTYVGLVEAAGVPMESFFDGWRISHLLTDQPANDPANFAAVCERIVEVRLPERIVTVSIHADLSITGGGSVSFQTGATSTLAGREYLARLASVSSEALRLLDLFIDTARAMGFTIAGD